MGLATTDVGLWPRWLERGTGGDGGDWVIGTCNLVTAARGTCGGIGSFPLGGVADGGGRTSASVRSMAATVDSGRWETPQPGGRTDAGRVRVGGCRRRSRWRWRGEAQMPVCSPPVAGGSRWACRQRGWAGGPKELPPRGGGAGPRTVVGRCRWPWVDHQIVRAVLQVRALRRSPPAARALRRAPAHQDGPTGGATTQQVAGQACATAGTLPEHDAPRTAAAPSRTGRKAVAGRVPPGAETGGSVNA